MALATARSPSAATKVPLCLFLRRKGTFCIGGRLRTLSRSEMGSASPAAERWGPEALRISDASRVPDLWSGAPAPSQTRVRDSGTWGSRGADPSSGAMEASEMRNEARWEQSLRRYIKSFQFHLGLKGFFIADGLELGQSPMFDHQFSEGERYNEQLLKWPLR
ncbi:MAG: hypothetical protein A3I75_03040 [Deltaproteobacteria bacterium RIFCSPLOWO2_02_FULL_50_16]|nr:MAG: hypothetical protein A2053_04935 [Deltaproteobacteria bacterium GWA2_50_8]OGQ56920.1 MAG: hypothetical protein A3I75_03040 [Deltaproteobacteria bacterium RIFCSPLOWO2_02_FULL_50_16]